MVPLCVEARVARRSADTHRVIIANACVPQPRKLIGVEHELTMMLAYPQWQDAQGQKKRSNIS
jgi:hypothetical protein